MIEFRPIETNTGDVILFNGRGIPFKFDEKQDCFVVIEPEIGNRKQRLTIRKRNRRIK